jgi:type I restriction enzyme, S subunit
MIKSVKLGDICIMQSGGTPRRGTKGYYEGEIPWAKIGDLESSSDGYIYQTEEYITDQGLKSINNRLFKKGTLLLAMYGSVGKVSFAGVEMSTNQAILGISPKNTTLLDMSYLKRWFEFKRPKLIQGARGVALQNISATIVKNLKIPLPPLPEQQRIAKILDAADTLRKKTQQIIDSYDELAQSVFLDMFGDVSANSMKWDKKPFDYFAKIDTQMTTDFENYRDFPHIGIANIEKATGKLIDYKKVEDEKIISGKYIFTKNHIIYSKIRPNLNKVALPDFDGLCSADAYPILVNKKNSNKYFFTFLLRSKSFLDFILSHSKRTNIPKANKEQMKKYQGIAPPLILQNQFAEKIKLIEKQKELAKQSLKESEDLFQSLLQKAFKGELKTKL